MAFTILTQGTFVQPATAQNMIIPLPSGVDYFTSTNLTQMATTQTTGRVVRGEWYGGGLTASNDGLRWTKSNSSSAINIDNFSSGTPSNGYTYVTSFPQPEAPLTGTTITNASPAVATVNNTYSNGDSVVIYNSVGAQMYSGMTFTISSVSGTGFTLLGLNTPGSAASAFTVRRVNKFAPVMPNFLYITAITRAAQGQVTVSQANSVYLGQKLVFQIPGSFGMVQLNTFNRAQDAPVVVTSIIDAYNFTINVNTTSFTPFAFPATALSPTATLFATVAPAGQSTQYNFTSGLQTGYNFTDIPFHTGIFVPYMSMSAGLLSPAGSAGDTIVWRAYKMETGTINAPVPS